MNNHWLRRFRYSTTIANSHLVAQPIKMQDLHKSTSWVILIIIMIIEIPSRLDNITKRPHYFRNVTVNKEQTKFNNSFKKVEIMDAFTSLECRYSNWWHHELNITTTYSTISGTWPNQITWRPFLHKLYTIPTSICKQYPNFRSTFIALATLGKDLKPDLKDLKPNL